MSKDTGGPAFPAAVQTVFDHGPTREPTVVDVATPGMTLRDYFAIHALPVAAKFYPGLSPTDQVNLAYLSYQLADAMLAERAKDGAA